MSRKIHKRSEMPQNVPKRPETLRNVPKRPQTPRNDPKHHFLLIINKMSNPCLGLYIYIIYIHMYVAYYDSCNGDNDDSDRPQMKSSRTFIAK